MKKDELYVQYGTAYKEMTKQLLEKINVAEMIGDTQKLIGIKPNLLGPIPAEEGATTHPEVVAGIIEYCREHDFTQLVVLESSWVGDKTSDALMVTGFDRLLEACDVPFWDLQEDQGVAVDGAGMTLNICARVQKIDYLINVPVLKGHCQTKMTCSLKNMKGLLPAAEKRRFHRLGLHEPIGHLSAAVHQDLIIVDSICGDLTFEDGGHPVEQNRLIAALDPVLCDTYGCSLLGIPVEEVPYIAMAAQSGVGSMALEQAHIYIEGESLQRERGAEDYRRLLRVEEIAEQVDSCSACYASLIPALLQMEEEGMLGQITDKICIGQGYRGKSGALGVGNCTRAFARYVPGCPPDKDEIYTFLREIAEEKRKTDCGDKL